MNNKEVTLLGLYDLSTAFDTIEQSILLNVLERDFGVIGAALGLIRFYLIANGVF